MKTNNALRVLLIALVLATGGILWMNLSGCGHKSASAQSKTTLYTCVMHHQIRRDKPGDCPICGMTLVPLDQVQGGTPSPVTESGSPSKKR